AGRWKKILLESSQQCRRVQLPILDPVAKPESDFAQPNNGIPILLSESPEARPLRDILTGIHATAGILAIGPEGGWTDAEFAAARAYHFHEASLGKLILRTETAVITALANLNFALTKD